MTHGMRMVIVLLAALVALPGMAMAQTHTHGNADVTTSHGDAVAEHGVYADDRYADLDAAAGNDEAAGALDTDASASDVASGESVWTWLEIRWTAFVAKLGDVLGLAGQETPDVDGGVEAYVSEDGVDLDASVAGVDFDESPVGHLDGETWGVMSQVKAAKGDVEEQLPPLPPPPSLPG